MAVLMLAVLPWTGIAATVRYYSYSGRDPARWTSSARASPEAAGPGDFTAFPCNASDCRVGQVITDANGNTYVVGSRYFPVPGSNPPAQTADVYVAKLDPAGATLFLVTLGGKGSDGGRAIALDAAGNIIIGGSTTSPNFPLRNAVQTSPGTNGGTGFLVKLGADGSQLIFSTYFGGSAGMSSVNAVAADAAGNAYAAGDTGSRDFPMTPGMPAGTVTGFGAGGTLGAFVAKVAAGGGAILYSGVISGGALACTGGSSCFLSIRSTSSGWIGLDAAGNVYVAGNTNVTDLPATGGALVRGGLGGWAARINASGAKLDYLTYLSSAKYGSGTYVSAATGVGGLAVDGGGNAYLVGRTSDPQFPTTPGAAQPKYNGPANAPPPGPIPAPDAFIAKLNPQGTAVVSGTFLGGSGSDAATGVALDSTGAVYVTGTTDSADFPVTLTDSTGTDFIAVLNPAVTALTFSSRYPGRTVSPAIAVGRDGRVRAASAAGLVMALTLNPVPGTRVFGIANAAQGSLGPAVAPGEVVSLFGTRLGPQQGEAAAPDSAGRMPASLAGTQVLFDGLPAPLLYVSKDQINAVTPFALAPGKKTTVQVISGNATSLDFPGVVILSQPAIFGIGSAAALNQDGTINSGSNPAKPGSVVTIWATGAGLVFPTPVDGQVAASAQDYHCCTMYVSDKPAETLYAGAAPGIVAGVVQINFRVPADLTLYGVLPEPIRIAVYSAAPAASSATTLYVSP